MELTRADLDMVLDMFAVLTKAASVHGVSAVEIKFNGEGGNSITVGFGENGEPAILDIESEEDNPPTIPWWPYPHVTWNTTTTTSPTNYEEGGPR